MPTIGHCKVCQHPRAEEIDHELLSPGMNKRSIRGIASLFHVSHETLRRHYHKCLSQSESQDLAETPEVPAQIQAMSVMFNQDLVARAVELNERAQLCGTPNQMMTISRELVRLLVDLIQDAENQ